MSRIVDDAGNLQQFTAAVSNVLASFGQRKNYGRPSRGEPPSLAAPIVQSQLPTSPAMHPHAYTPGSPWTPPPAYTAQDVQDTSSAILPSREVNQATSQIINSLLSFPTHGDHKPAWIEDRFKPIHDDTPATPEVAINKHLDSPQLTGLRAPPPTPETWAHKTPPTGPLYGNRLGDDPLEEELLKEDLLISHIQKHMIHKPVHVGLGESMYAPRRPSRLATEDGHTRYTSSGRDVSPMSRRERDNSFERLSFVVASASKTELLSKITAESMTRSDGSDARQTMASPQTSEEKREVVLQPPQLSVTTPSSVRNQTAEDKQAQVKPDKVTLAPSPSLGLVQPTKTEQAHVNLETITAAPASRRATGHSAKDERAHVKTEKTIVVPPNPAMGQPAKGERVQRKQEKVPAEPPIIAFKVGLQSFLDKYNAQNQAATPKLDPEPLERTIVPVAKHVYSPEPTQFLAPAEKAGAGVEAPSRIKWISAIASDVIQSQQPKAGMKSTRAMKNESSLPPDPRVIREVLNDTETPKLLTGPGDKSSSGPRTPLGVIAVSKRDVPSASKDEIPRTPSTSLGTIVAAPVKFKDLSPQTSRYILRPAATNASTHISDNTDKTHETYFTRYPPPERRENTVARVRRAIISGLPIPSSSKFVASLVYGGLVENIVMKPNGIAEVLFVKPDECFRFCDDNKNGLVYGKGVYEKHKNRDLFVLVKPHADVDVVGGKLGELILQGATRCVRVVWVDLDYTTHDLWKLAEGKNRKVEHIVDTTKTVEIESNGKMTTKEVYPPRFRRPFPLCIGTDVKCSVEISPSASARCKTQTAFVPHSVKIWIGSTVPPLSPLIRKYSSTLNVRHDTDEAIVVPPPQVSISMTELSADYDFKVFNTDGKKPCLTDL
ncbi:hypothetical protein MMC18_002976 [Xylographa bjoerkii]|nr:hypothetical protein [Xylographa bjoerkii]